MRDGLLRRNQIDMYERLLLRGKDGVLDGWRFENQEEILCVVDGDNHDFGLGYNDDFYDDNNKFWMDS